MNPAEDIWNKVLELMKNDMTTTTINTWFEDASAVALEGDRFVLCSPTSFKRDIIVSRYVPAIQKALKELFSADISVNVLTEEERKSYDSPQDKRTDFLPGTEDYTFERFVVGSSNKFAHAAAHAVADNPGGSCLSTASPAWARPTCSTQSPTRSIRSPPGWWWSTSRARRSPMS